jgi:outer membrane protein TolC
MMRWTMTRGLAAALATVTVIAAGGFGRAGAQDEPQGMPTLSAEVEYDRHGAVMPASDVKVDLSLRDAVTQSLLNHPDLQAVWHSGDAEGADIAAEHAVYDAMFNAQINVPVTNQTMVFSRELANVSLSRRYTSGTRLAAEYHLERDPDGLFVSADGSTELYRHRFGLRVEQALARNAGRGANLAGIRAEQHEYAAAAEDYRRYANEVVYAVEEAYWKLYAAQRIEAVFNESLAGAQRLLELAGTQYASGDLSKLELTVAEAGVESRREDVIIARIDADKSRDLLMAMMLGSTAPNWLSSRVTLLTPPDSALAAAEDLPTLDEVLARRNDYQAAELQMAAASERILAARNGSRNRFDLVLEGGYAAMGSSPGNEYLDPISGQAVSGPYLFAGIDVEMALPGSRSRAENRRAAAARQSAHWQRESVQRAVVLEIRQAMLDLESSRERVRVTRTARAAVEEQIRGEREKFAMGHTSSQTVLLAENDLRAARIREIRALADLQVARARLRLAVGTTLDEFGLALD